MAFAPLLIVALLAPGQATSPGIPGIVAAGKLKVSKAAPSNQPTAEAGRRPPCCRPKRFAIPSDVDRISPVPNARY